MFLGTPAEAQSGEATGALEFAFRAPGREVHVDPQRESKWSKTLVILSLGDRRAGGRGPVLAAVVRTRERAREQE